MTLQEAVEYEILSSWWAKYIFWNWGQELSGRYFAWKTQRKYARYEKSIKVAAFIRSLK